MPETAWAFFTILVETNPCMSNRIGFKRIAMIFMLVIPAVAACGCNPEKVAAVSGTVTYMGKPLPGGTITFMNEERTKQDIVPINPDGTYSAARVPWGKVLVGVYPAGKSRAELVSGDTQDSRKPPKESPFAGNFDKTSEGKYVDIPMRLRDPFMSGISVEIDTSPKSFDITLPER
jgi:hypothetical protein